MRLIASNILGMFIITGRIQKSKSGPKDSSTLAFYLLKLNNFSKAFMKRKLLLIGNTGCAFRKCKWCTFHAGVFFYSWAAFILD